jgi:hypothetical protein
LDRATDLKIIQRNAETSARTMNRLNGPVEEEWCEVTIKHLVDPVTVPVPSFGLGWTTPLIHR